MTTNLPGGASYTRQQVEMMQVRQAAQAAQYDAAAAQMARSADQKIEDQHQNVAISEAREYKKLKREAADRLKWERAHNAYNKVSADQMATWRDPRGNVRVERNVPNEFLDAIRDEEMRMLREEMDREKGFKPFKTVGRAATDAIFLMPMVLTAPLDKKSSPPPPQQSPQGQPAPQQMPQFSEPQEKKGMFSKLKAPKLPFGGGGNKPVSPFAGSAPAPTQPAAEPGRIPHISGAALVDGTSPVGGTSAPSPPPAPANTSTADYGQTMQAAATTFSEPTKKRGLFSRMGSGSSGGLFSKKKSSPTNAVDASLFPAGSVNQAPTGGSLSGGHTMASSNSMQTGSVGSVALPGQQAPEKKRGFSLPKPKIPSGPTMEKKAPAPKVNAGGFYTTQGNAQFMKYGADRETSEITTLPPGVSVQVTKPGAEWAGIRLNDGSEGVIRVKDLR